MQLDMSAAEVTYRRALELSSEGPRRAAILVKLADTLQEQGRLLEAERAYEDALSALRSQGEERGAALGMIGLARALWRHGDTTRASELTAAGIPVLERDPGPDLVRAYEHAAVVDAIGGRSREAVEWAEKGIALAGTLGLENVVRHLQMRGLARIDLGDAAGIDDLRGALELSLGLGLGIETGTSHLNLGEMITVHRDIRP